MAENSSIEWCDHTFNPWRGCTKVSPGCAHCYAAREAVRFPSIRGTWGDSGTRIVAVPDAWKAPVKWNRRARAAIDSWQIASDTWGGEAAMVDAGFIKPRRPRVFCASLADVFEDWKGQLRFSADIAPDGYVRARWDGRQMVREFEASADEQGLALATMDNAREELFRLIEATPYLDWLLLTKRPENVMRMVPEHWREAFPPNVWMGTTVENQDMANKRIPELLKIPAKVRFLSCEPLLGHVDLCTVFDIWWNQTEGMWYRDDSPSTCVDQHGQINVEATRRQNRSGIHWVIAGGESGPQARPMHPIWAQSLREQCQNAGVPFLFKQWGEWEPRDEWSAGPVIQTAIDPSGKTVPSDVAPQDIGGHRHVRVGKKAAGRLLDGQEWNEFPKP